MLSLLLTCAVLLSMPLKTCGVPAPTWVDYFEREFQNYDLDKNGLLTLEEVDKFFSFTDTNRDGFVSFDELRIVSVLPGTMMSRQFRLLDANRDGKVELSEIKTLFGKRDRDGDGSLSLTEYIS